MSDIEKSVQRVIETYQSAVHARDAAALMRLYDPKVRVFDAWGVWSYEGAEAWQRAVEGWFTSLGSERVKVTFEEVVVTELGVSGPASGSAIVSAIVSAVVTYAGLSAEGKPLHAMQNRLTWGLKTSGHVLRVVHEHTSAPIGFDDQKAILQRHAKGP